MHERVPVHDPGDALQVVTHEDRPALVQRLKGARRKTRAVDGTLEVRDVARQEQLPAQHPGRWALAWGAHGRSFAWMAERVSYFTPSRSS